jgi:hypothetical protein
MTASVIDLASRLAARAEALDGFATPAAILSEQNPADNPPCAANLFHMHSRSLLSLPFVTLPLEECADWGEFWRRTTMWNDEPGDKGHVDHHRGHQYARDAIAAIISDGAGSRGLEMVVDAIFKRGFARRGPGGRLCRQLAPAESGFMDEICEIAVEALRRKGRD